MEVRAGYKQTEVGVIPGDWAVKSLGSLASLVASGRSSSKSTIGDFPVHGSTGIIGHTANPEYEGAALLVARVGANAGRLNFVSGRYGVTDNTIMLRLAAACDLAFVWRQLEAKRLNNLVFGSGQPLITGTQLKALPLALPSLPEQRAIAAALSDVDALLGGLDRLIAKKRDLKQAAMQQLLTGQTRLPGFHGEWRPKTFADLLKYERPDKYLVRSADYEEKGDTPVLTANKSFVLGYTDENFGIYENPPVIIFDDFTTDSKYVDFVFKVKSSAIKILKGRTADVSLRFVFERMRLVRFPLGEHKRYYISEYQHIELPTPEGEEQHAIAVLLSDMDAELAALETRRDKTRALKQAMMQELLTGRTRLA